MRNSPQHLKPEQRNSRADHITEEMTEYLDCVAKTHVPCAGCPAGKGRIGRLWETAPPPRSPARLAVRSTSGRRGGSGGSAGPSPSQRRASVGSDLALASPFWGLCPWSPLRLRLPQRDIPASPLGLPPCVALQRGPPRPTTEDHGPTWSPQHEPGAALRPSRGPHPRGRVAAAPSGENAHCNSPGAWELSMGRRLKCPGEQAPVPQGGCALPRENPGSPHYAGRQQDRKHQLPGPDVGTGIDFKLLEKKSRCHFSASKYRKRRFAQDTVGAGQGACFCSCREPLGGCTLGPASKASVGRAVRASGLRSSRHLLSAAPGSPSLVPKTGSVEGAGRQGRGATVGPVVRSSHLHLFTRLCF